MLRLNAEQFASFRDDGFLVVENLLAEREVDDFLAHLRHPDGAMRDLRTHAVNEHWNRICRHPNVAGVAAQILGGVPRIVQSMYLPKSPLAEGEDTPSPGIALHQDSHYLPTEPNTLMACWIALSDTGPDNGGFCVKPGSHKGGLLPTHRNEDDEHVSWEIEYLMRDRDGKEWKQQMYSFQIDGIGRNDVSHLTVPKGAGVFFSGMMIHGSFGNSSREKARHAFAVHYVKDGTWVLRADVQDALPVPEVV